MSHNDLYHTPSRRSRRNLAESAFNARIEQPVREVVSPLARSYLCDPLPDEDLAKILRQMAASTVYIEMEAQLDRDARRALDQRFEDFLEREVSLDEDTMRKIATQEQSLRQQLASAPPRTEDEIAAFTEEQVSCVKRSLLSSWFHSLRKFAGNGGTLFLSALDDCSLPPNIDQNAFFGNAWCLDADFGHLQTILRKIRADLPQREILPPEMIELLSTYDITVAP